MKSLVRSIAASALLFVTALPALAQYPAKPVTIVSPFAAGGDSDLSARNLAQHVAKYMNNQPIVVINRVGASGSIGTGVVRNSAPDGYTLLVARIASHAILPAMDTKTPYKYNDFTLLSLLETNPYTCVVKGDSPYKSMNELIDDIRKNPGKLNFSTSGIGTVQNLGVQYLMTLVGLTKDHAVGIHYKGGGEVTTSLLGGQVQFACNNLNTLVSHVKAGTFRALMVNTPQRMPDLPNVPTAREVGLPEMERIVGWTALVGPPGMAKEAVDKWVDALGKLAKDPDWLAGNVRIAGIPGIRSQADTATFFNEQYDLYYKLAVQLGIRE